MSTVDEVDRLRTELELDYNRFLLIRRLIERKDYAGVASTADVAILRLSKTLNAGTEARASA